MTEDEMVGWHHRLDEHEFEHAPGVSDGQGSQGCCRPWSRKESGMTITELREERHKSNTPEQREIVTLNKRAKVAGSQRAYLMRILRS